ncbi:collagen alpha-1(XXV) chain-like [Orbicella faveolata]|uniref:collagen alpha-1(XXV) chain-like n=1 Tax=Orbicella faveolata TaxID=48498 RepID=UPI0009E303AC|nr:collagen alpha-1(XXV) chain-like [Orbicella faveolata]
MEATNKPEKQQPSSFGTLQKVLIFLVVLAVCVGFFVGLLLVRTRLTSLEETVNDLSEVCETPSWGSNSNQRNRRDTGSVSLEDVRSEIQTQLRSLTASQLCSPPDKICVDGQPGAKGEPGERGKRGKRGWPGRKGDDGFPGPKGLDGRDGMPGYKGIQGFPGIQGERGEDGVPGMPGDKGDPGFIGPSGVKGEIGEPGFNGLPGAKGQPGAKGEKGESGISS